MPLTMTTSAIADGQQIDAADVLTPLNQIKTFVDGMETSLNSEIATRASADNNLIDGVTAFNQLNLGAVGALTIASDTITVTKSRHQIDTQGGAGTDDLSTINGFVSGDILVLQSVSLTRTINIKHNVGNIFNYAQSDVVLDHPSKAWLGLYDATSAKWCQLSTAQSLLVRGLLNTTLLSLPVVSVTDGVIVNSGYGAPRLEFEPSIIVRNQFHVRASGATIQADMIAAPTLTGTAASSNQADSSYVNITSGIVAGNVAGFVSTFDLLQRRYNPKFECLIRTPSLLTTLRIWIGLVSAAPTNVDDLAATVSGIGFRYSSVAGDTAWKGFLDDGTVMGLTADMDAVVADTRYLLRIRVDGTSGGVAYFSINNGTEVALTTGMPASATNLGVAVYVIPNVAAARNLLFSRLRVEHD